MASIPMLKGAVSIALDANNLQCHEATGAALFANINELKQHEIYTRDK